MAGQVSCRSDKPKLEESQPLSDPDLVPELKSATQAKTSTRTVSPLDFDDKPRRK